MKSLTLFCLTAILLLGSCSKDNITPELMSTPYVKATINKVPFCLYEDSVATYESAEFSYGTAILTMTQTGEVVDSSLTIRASRGGMHISLKFPYRDAVNQKTITLYRNTADITHHWASAGLESVSFVNGMQQGMLFTTHCFYEENKLSEPVGQVNISSFDASNKTMTGTFSFTAYGYKHENSKVVETNEQLTVEDGEFYIVWENEPFK